MVSCSREQQVNDDFSTTSADKLLQKMKILSKENKGGTRFQLAYENGKYRIEKSSIAPLTFEEGFTLGYERVSGGAVKVECVRSDGSKSATTCSSGAEQGTCVGTAITNCVNGGGVKKAVAIVYMLD